MRAGKFGARRLPAQRQAASVEWRWQRHASAVHAPLQCYDLRGMVRQRELSLDLSQRSP